MTTVALKSAVCKVVDSLGASFAPKVTVVLDRETPEVTDRYRRLFPGGVTFFLDGFEAYLRRCESGAPEGASA